jgi:hypothetical protein
MAGAFGSELTFLINGGAFLWFAASDIRVLKHGSLSDLERAVKHVVRVMMLMYSLAVAVILVNVAPHLFPGMQHPAGYLFSLGAPALFFIPINILLLRHASTKAGSRRSEVREMTDLH